MEQREGELARGQGQLSHPTEGTTERVWGSVLLREVIAGLQWFLIIHLMLAVIKFFWNVICHRGGLNSATGRRRGKREKCCGLHLNVSTHGIYSYTPLCHLPCSNSPWISYSSNLKLMPAKLAFRGQETFSVKSAPLWVALVCKGKPSLAWCCMLGIFTA